MERWRNVASDRRVDVRADRDTSVPCMSYPAAFDFGRMAPAITPFASRSTGGRRGGCRDYDDDLTWGDALNCISDFWKQCANEPQSCIWDVDHHESYVEFGKILLILHALI